MTAQPLPALASGDPSAWDQALYAFLVEKGNRSGSRRTVESYSRMLWPFFADLGKSPDRVKPADILAWVHGIGKSGRPPSATTVGAWIACLSSFYRFLIRMGLVVSDPTDAVERPRTVQSVARGYSADEVRRLLAVVPDTVAGRRDRAILLTLVLTGRRRAEVIGLRAGDLSLEGETTFYAYRGKGGKRGRRELPDPAFQAICTTLSDAGMQLATMAPEESLWQGRRDVDLAGVTLTRCRRETAQGIGSDGPNEAAVESRDQKPDHASPRQRAKDQIAARDGRQGEWQEDDSAARKDQATDGDCG
jgi:site-specific recombinase XerD